jgi:hypothetical protein
MGSDCTKLYFDTPFPYNSESTHVVRKVERIDPLHGPSVMPYVSKTTNTVLDAIGRPIIEDGINRLITSSLLSRILVHKVPINTNLLIGRALYYTKNLNEMMINLEMEAFCVLDYHHVLIFSSNPSRKFIENSVASVGIATTIASLDDSLNRPTVAQLNDVVMRMTSSFHKYGVGALVKDAEGFNFHILVPNVPEYEKYKEKYDEIESKIKKDEDDKIEKERKIADNFRHASTKRTRSGKKYDDGHNTTRDTYAHLNRIKRMRLKREKRDASNAKRTRSGKIYNDGYSTNAFLNRTINRMKRTRI